MNTTLLSILWWIGLALVASACAMVILPGIDSDSKQTILLEAGVLTVLLILTSKPPPKD